VLNLQGAGLSDRLSASIRRLAKVRFFRKAWATAPMDLQYGISTSASERKWWLRSGNARVDQANVGYVGSQPSVVRHALDIIEGIERAVFVDLGCVRVAVFRLARSSLSPSTPLKMRNGQATRTGLRLSVPM
jgi:hypothetical protein